MSDTTWKRTKKEQLRIKKQEKKEDSSPQTWQNFQQGPMDSVTRAELNLNKNTKNWT